MKKLLVSLSLLASLASFAEENAIEATAQITGVLPITTSAQSVIVCVPWVAPGYATDAAISVSNVIKTANLTVGDTVKVWNSSKNAFDVWTLTEGTGGVKYWQGITVVQASGLTQTDGADVTTLARGGALILTRASAPSAAYTFYVCGQYTSSSAADVTMAQGSTETPAYTLVAPPIVSGGTYNLNTSMTWSNLPSTAETRGMTAGDYIQCGDANGVAQVYYLSDKSDELSNNNWGYRGGTMKKPTWQAAGDIAAGTGFWYVSRGGQPTVKWSN